MATSLGPRGPSNCICEFFGQYDLVGPTHQRSVSTTQRNPSAWIGVVSHERIIPPSDIARPWGSNLIWVRGVTNKIRVASEQPFDEWTDWQSAYGQPLGIKPNAKTWGRQRILKPLLRPTLQSLRWGSTFSKLSSPISRPLLLFQNPIDNGKARVNKAWIASYDVNYKFWNHSWNLTEIARSLPLNLAVLSSGRRLHYQFGIVLSISCKAWSLFLSRFYFEAWKQLVRQTST